MHPIKAGDGWVQVSGLGTVLYSSPDGGNDQAGCSQAEELPFQGFDGVSVHGQDEMRDVQGHGPCDHDGPVILVFGPRGGLGGR